MMKMLITGATGKVGSRFAPRMIQHGHDVKVLVRDVAQAQALEQQGAQIIHGDLVQPDSYLAALQDVDVIVHLAAKFRGVDEETTRTANTDGSLALAHAALQAGVSRFVFASTNNVYGTGGADRPKHEDDELNPLFAYPQSKVAAETALLELHREQGLGLRIVRLPFVYGDRDPHIADFLPYVKQWNPAKRIHMGHHADISQALLLAASVPGIDGRIYNVADDAPISAAELLRFHGEESLPEAAQQEYDAWDMVVDTMRIRNELHYRPVYPSFYSAWAAGAL